MSHDQWSKEIYHWFISGAILKLFRCKLIDEEFTRLYLYEKFFEETSSDHFCYNRGFCSNTSGSAEKKSNQSVSYHLFFSLLRYMKKLPSSDSLKYMQFSGNSVQKRVNSAQRSNKPDWTIPWTVQPDFELFCALKMWRYRCILLFWSFAVVLTERTRSLAGFE